MALRTGLFPLDLADGSLAALATAPFDRRRFIFNEGDTDRQGRVWAGPMDVPLAPGTPPVQTGNSLAWSADGRRVFFGDTAQKSTWTATYDTDHGRIGAAKLFAHVDIEGADGPDGMAIDRDGHFSGAIFGGSRLLRFGPDGDVERTVVLPVRSPTMPAFGGADMKTLLVTSALWPVADERRERHPGEGHLLASEVDVPGFPATRFAAG